MADKRRRYRLYPLAETDLEDIWQYTVRTWSPKQAERYHAGIVATLEDLTQGPKTGRPIDIRDGYFKYPVGSHVVFFALPTMGSDVVRILHQRMDVSRHL